MLLEHERYLWFGHGCSGDGDHMLLEHERYLWFGHECSGDGDHMLLEHERNYDLGMDARRNHLLAVRPHLLISCLQTLNLSAASCCRLGLRQSSASCCTLAHGAS